MQMRTNLRSNDDQYHGYLQIFVRIAISIYFGLTRKISRVVRDTCVLYVYKTQFTARHGTMQI